MFGWFVNASLKYIIILILTKLILKVNGSENRFNAFSTTISPEIRELKHTGPNFIKINLDEGNHFSRIWLT